MTKGEGLKLQINNKIKYELNPKKCIKCNSNLSYEKRKNKYCNHSCAASYTNKGYPKYGIAKTEKECLGCKNKTLNPKYCSQKCQHVYEYNKAIEDWKSGTIKGINLYKENCQNFIRKYLFEKYDNKCSKCGWCEINPTSNKIPLQVEHIDGNWKNNSEENLTLLCPNCHSLTSTFGNLNKGNGRPGRRERDRIKNASVA